MEREEDAAPLKADQDAEGATRARKPYEAPGIEREEELELMMAECICKGSGEPPPVAVIS